MNKKKDKHIVLMGFKNAGKTVVGKELGKRIGLPFLDLDAEIEKQAGMKCREIVQTQGEKAFRTIETETLKKVLATDTPYIVALGGGAILAAENQELIREHKKALITGDKNTLFNRIIKKGRPMIFGKEGTDREAFERVYTEREPMYEQLADMKVDNSGKVESAVEEIIKHLTS